LYDILIKKDVGESDTAIVKRALEAARKPGGDPEVPASPDRRDGNVPKKPPTGDELRTDHPARKPATGDELKTDHPARKPATGDELKTDHPTRKPAGP
jgi:hypothetical protein